MTLPGASTTATSAKVIENLWLADPTIPRKDSCVLPLLTTERCPQAAVIAFLALLEEFQSVHEEACTIPAHLTVPCKATRSRSSTTALPALRRIAQCILV